MQLTLRDIRNAKDYTIHEVAEYCGVSAEEIEEIEIDSSEISYDLLIKITDLYRVPPDCIYLGVTKR